MRTRIPTKSIFVAALLSFGVSYNPFALHVAWAGADITPNLESQRVLSQLTHLISTETSSNSNAINASLNKLLSELSKSTDEKRGALVEQLFLHRLQATNMEQAMLSYVVIGRLAITNTEIRVVMLPFLESTNSAVRKLAHKWLDEADKRAGCFLDLQPYERILCSKLDETPDGLIHLMFHRDPCAMLIICSRIYGSPGNQSIIATNLAKFSPKVTLGAESAAIHFASHGEWWEKMFIIEFLRAHPQDWDAKLLRQLEDEKHALVKSASSELLVQRRWPTREGKVNSIRQP